MEKNTYGNDYIIKESKLILNKLIRIMNDSAKDVIQNTIFSN